MPPELVEQGDSLDGQVVAVPDEAGFLIERGQPCGRVFAEALAQLVELVEQAGVVGGRTAGPHVGGSGGDRPPPDVVLGDAEIALDNREARVVRSRAPPGPDRVVVPPAVVQQVAEVVGRARIARVKQHCCLEDPDLLEAGRKAVVGGGRAPPGGVTASSVVVAATRFEPCHRVGHERVDGAGCLGPGQDFEGLLVEACDRVIVGDIEMDLDAAWQGHIGRAAGQEVALVEGPGVEGVVAEHGVDGLERAVGSARAAEQRCAKHPRPRVAGVRRERAFHSLECPV